MVRFSKMNKYCKLFFVVSLPLYCAMDVYYIPGGLEDYLKMTKHPGDTELNEMSMCMRSGKSIFVTCISSLN